MSPSTWHIGAMASGKPKRVRLSFDTDPDTELAVRLIAARERCQMGRILNAMVREAVRQWKTEEGVME